MILNSHLMLCCLFIYLNAQWYQQSAYLIQNKLFIESTGLGTTYQTEGFINSTQQLSANFINCATPNTSYITLNSKNTSAQKDSPQLIPSGGIISFDLYFHDNWLNEAVTFTIESFYYTYTYTSPTTYPSSIGFCNSTPYEVKTINFTVTSQVSGYIKFSTNVAGNGQVSIRNIIFSQYKMNCFPTCSTCTGPEYNQCTTCYQGYPTHNICPQCPLNLFYRQNQGCKQNCPFSEQKYVNGFCQTQLQSYHISAGFWQFVIQSSSPPPSIFSQYSLIYDPQNIDTSPQVVQNGPTYLFGIFKLNSGPYRFIIISRNLNNYLIGLKIQLLIFDNIPLGCGVQIKINNTYYGSIFSTNSEVLSHKFKIEEVNIQSTCISPYISCQLYKLYGSFDIPPYSFLLTVQGNYTQSQSLQKTQKFGSWMGCKLY
ncbi:unnamed protein product (macronuclear) [Paramecium tetraurelia]|uniref:TNFR-Cys domain-containing protein n=1 Tax=Paramecium tetraurelia TaxID=5888 RepID=A0DJ99_PARTE|nr:uncharacterized protein GSPATT00039529001 [Paramecium tetraurelia]CAK83116.1 unnamed protein product [Paramecium tetraurelia]|eukprot:XP_001450513.1 hypothetical protein (macronuclear) [Paramecium tetraurelia strain d4-2]